MAKFNVGDKVVVRDDKELLVKSNLAQQLASLLCGFGIDEIEAGATGVIASVKDNNIYAVDFGENYKGVKADGTKDGTCAAITEELLELVVESNDCDSCDACADTCNEDFKPYLLLAGTEHGGYDEKLCYIGEPTSLKTSKGNPLYTGDVVEVNNEAITVVVKDEDGEYFMGYKLMLLYDGCINKVVKKVSYEKVNHGDVICHVKYVKYEEECDE